MKIHLATLKTTQSWVRSLNQVKRMIEHVKNGGVFTIDNVQEFHPEDKVFPLIRISQFPDGELYLHDGHHRAVAIWLGGRDELDANEYELQQGLSFEKYAEMNIDAGWYTPVNLLNEVRLPDTRVFKGLVQETPRDEAEGLITSLKHMYATPRQHDSVVDLANEIALRSGIPLR